ncbi:MAG: hypothetical protein J5J00_00795 [Deltaproteobacteria bacterium]|nr:hypothetical protein [Deltaproteobacteria bacterium]
MKQQLIRSLSIALLLTALSPAITAAQQTLSEVGLFYRCYAHLTQLRPRLEDPLLAQVKAGSKSAVQACREIFSRATFTANSGTTIADPADAVAKAIVHTFNELHRSWAREQVLFNPSDNNARIGTEPWFEDSPMGPYVTRALLSPSHNVDSVTQGTDFLQPVREIMDPPRSYGGVPRTVAGSERDWRLGEDHPFAPRGDILGIRRVYIPPIPFFAPVRFTNLGAMPDFANIGAPAASRAIAEINFADVTAVQGPIAETEQFAIRIRGKLRVPTTDNYTLYLNVDDAGIILLNGERIVNRTSSGEGSATLTLPQGDHDLTVEYRQRTTGARLIMSWQSSTIVKQAIPAASFAGLVADYYTHSQARPVQLTGNEGGGFLGNHNYLLTTYAEPNINYVPDGALLTNRSWARAVFADALCREIPVVRESDVYQFVVANSQTPFREAAACVSCHASLDRGLSGVIRGLRWNTLGTVTQTSPAPDLFGINLIDMRAPSLGEDRSWSDEPSADYSKRAPYGHFFFRNYKGELVDQEIRSIEELGSAIRQQDDYYACFAKRYYYYLTGIEVELGDPGNPSYPQLNDVQKYHRAKVIEYGNRLKSSKDLSQLLFDIIGSQEYRMTDYGVTYKGPSA